MFKNLGTNGKSGGGLLRNVLIMLAFMALASAASATCYKQVCVNCWINGVERGSMIDYYDDWDDPHIVYCYSGPCTYFQC